MRKEFIVNRQGRDFVLYVGLLDMGHEKGLKSIVTCIVQIPTDANNRVAICTATATFEADGVQRVFEGIGDAAPNNVAPAMQTCLLRMAETRAKARALRDGVNIGVAAFEELGEEDDHRPATRPTSTRTAVQRNDADEEAVRAAAEAEAAERAAAAKAKADAEKKEANAAEAKQALTEFKERADELGYKGDIKLLARHLCKVDKPLTVDLRTAINAKNPVWIAAIDELLEAPATLGMGPTAEEIAAKTSEQTIGAQGL